MKISNVINSAVVFAAKGDVRYYLNGVNIYHKDGLISAVASTDGHCMQIIKTDAVRGDLVNNCDGSFIINLNDCRRVSAIFDGKLINEVAISEILGLIEPIDGRFPDVTRSIPDGEPALGGLEIGVNYKYLAKISSSMSKLSKGKAAKYPIAKLTMRGASEAIRVDVADESYEGVSVVIVIMPARL